MPKDKIRDDAEKKRQELFKLLRHYEELYTISSEAEEKIIDLSALLYAVVDPQTIAAKELFVTTMQAVFNYGYECGQKSKS